VLQQAQQQSLFLSCFLTTSISHKTVRPWVMWESGHSTKKKNCPPQPKHGVPANQISPSAGKLMMPKIE